VEYLGSDRYVYGTVEFAPDATVDCQAAANIGRAIPEEEGGRLDFAVPEARTLLFRRPDRGAGAALKFADREDLLGAAMLGPALAYVILLVGVPFVLAHHAQLFERHRGSLTLTWAGFRNYSTILADRSFLRSLSQYPRS